MSNESRKTRSWLAESVAVVLSVVALLVSAYSLVAARQQHRDERATELIDQIYDDWDQMSAPDRWEVSHLAEVPATYEAVRDVLRAYATALPIQEKRRLLLLERTTAIRILVAFELALNQWRRAIAIGDLEREEVLDQEIDFYTEVFLRNPRLLWLWAEDGGGLVHQMDPPTVEFYDQRVLRDPDHPLTIEPDPDGILPAFDGLDGGVS